MAKSIPNDIYQYSLASALRAGLTDGGPPVAFLTNHGTHGIGVFESPDDTTTSPASLSDMIQIDSTAYTLSPSGAATPSPKDDHLPFVMVTVFAPTARAKPPPGTNSARLRDVFAASGGKNTPLPFRITGNFKYISTKQATYWDVSGTIFGFAVPGWQAEVSGEGLQACFLDGERQKGGRVREFEVGEGSVVEWAKCGRFHLGFPQDEEFGELRL